MNRAIDWFARNSVAANLMMGIIIIGGILAASQIALEVFPEIDLDIVTVEVSYLGAAPQEVEEAVCLRIEEAIEGIDGIKQITSTASEGRGTVQVELELGADARKVVDDIKSAVDAIDTFPEETEAPLVREATTRRDVINVAIAGDADERTLKVLAERVRDDLSALPEITQVEINNARPYEISIEVSEATLRRYGLTFDQVADAVRQSSLDLPGGSVKSDSGEILLRTKGQAYRGEEYESLVLRTRPDGSRILLGDVAEVVDGFAETDQLARFDGQPAVLIAVYSTGDQGAIAIAERVRQYVAEAQAGMPPGIRLTTLQDQAQLLDDRLSLMLRNGATGFVFVFLVLALFIELRLAFWVSLGIPVSFLGALWVVPGVDITLNMITLFAFILVLGIVVDDAIIVGENVATRQAETGDALGGAIAGTQEVAVPVVFAVLTTVAAFSPLLFVPGMMGKMFQAIPLIVIPCLLFSLVESLVILPAHLASVHRRRRRGPLARLQGSVVAGLRWFVAHVYQPSLEVALRWRYLTAAVGVAALVLTGGFVAGGHLAYEFFPSVESDAMSAAVTMPQGTPAEVTVDAIRRLEASAEQLRRQALDDTGLDIFRHVQASVGGQPNSGGFASQMGGGVSGGAGTGHLGEVTVELAPSEERTEGSDDIRERWRTLTGSIPEAVELSFNASMFSMGEDIDVQLTGPNVEELRAIAAEVRTRLADYAGVYEISDSFREGKAEVTLGIRPGAETLGLTLADLGRQVRQAFYGEEAQRIQRARDDVRVMVRYPERERRSVGDLENMRVRTPAGVEVPFNQVAVVSPGRGYASITRVDRRRAVDVTAAVDGDVVSSSTVLSDLEARVLPELLASHPDVRYSFEGMQAMQRDAMGGLERGFALALFTIFALLAVPLRSYVQPFIIMLAIPFGLAGALWGHLLLGYTLTMMSAFGMIALAGVVVNDSLVMVHFINQRRAEHADLPTAVREAGGARFRAILLTSLTTFAGLTPLLLEQSMQARFLIPMAISLAFGVIFATFVTLFLVPVSYMILEDLRTLAQRVFGGARAGEEAPTG